MSRKQLLLLNGSSRGQAGNSHRLLALAAQHLPATVDVESLVLADELEQHPDRCCTAWSRQLERSAGLIIATGTYWDSWGWPLQRFLEWMTPAEGTPLWLGKPVGVLVTMHSVGGKGVLSRLQGVLNTLGATIPPMSGMVYSTVAHEHFLRRGSLDPQSTTGTDRVGDDLWSLSDLEIVCRNVVNALEHGDGDQWARWAVDRSQPVGCWLD